MKGGRERRAALTTKKPALTLLDEKSGKRRGWMSRLKAGGLTLSRGISVLSLRLKSSLFVFTMAFSIAVTALLPQKLPLILKRSRPSLGSIHWKLFSGTWLLIIWVLLLRWCLPPAPVAPTDSPKRKLRLLKYRLQRISMRLAWRATPKTIADLEAALVDLWCSEWPTWSAVEQRAFLLECGFTTEAVDLIMRRQVKIVSNLG